MAFQLNQPFASALKGMIVNGSNTNRVSCIIDPASVITFYGATKVKISGSSNGITYVEKAAATDRGFGFITYSPIKNTFVAGDRVEVALVTNVMNMEAGAAIAAGVAVEQVATGDKVITAAGTNKICGYTITSAASSGDIVQVEIEPVNSGTIY